MDAIERLKKEVELRFRKTPASPSDFDALSLAISSATGENVSPSTLKRIWNYVKYDHTPTHSVCSVLARYTGYLDWDDFQKSEGITDVSDFIRQDVLRAENLEKGTIIEVRWIPDRRCKFLYRGNGEFEVISAVNSKLQAGDVFKNTLMAEGEPLYCTDLRHDDESIAGYVAAKIRGITDIQVKTPSAG